MKKIGVCLVILIAALMLVPLSFALYEPKATILNKFKSLVALHPLEASYAAIGQSPKGTPILIFRFGNPSSTGRVLWDAQLHGGEDAGSETSYLFCAWLFSGDSQAKYILAHNYVLVIPVVDDLISRVNEDHVNLNRNFPVGWGRSGSSDPTSLEYRGRSAGSEPETKALTRVYSLYRPKFYVNAHMYGGPRIFYNTAIPSSVITTLKSRLATYGKIYGGDPTYTNGFSRMSGGGFAIGTSESYGAYSFLWEIGGSTRPALSTVTSQYYKETRCFMIALCSMCG